MSGFCGSTDSVESSPVEKDSGDSIRTPPIYGCCSTDEQILIYLRTKVADPSFFTTAVEEGDLYSFEPWDFFPRIIVGNRERFFFSRRDVKDSTDQRIDRSTHSGLGYWKPTGEDTEIFQGKTLVGMKKTLVFYGGSGERTDWVMHEYRLEGDNSLHNLPQNAKNEWVICKVFLKSSLEKETYFPFGIHLSITLFSILIFLATFNVHRCRRSTLKRKGGKNKYVGGVRQLQPKLQKSNSDAENPASAAASSSISSHSNTTIEDNSRVCVKVGYNNDIVMFLLPSATMDSLKAEILKRFNKLDESFKIMYKDEDEEMVTIACDEDLHDCLEFFKSTGTTPVTLSLSI